MGNVSIDSHSDTESDIVEKCELLLFDVLEKEKIFEGKIEILSSDVELHKIVVNPIQFKFLLSQMEKIKNFTAEKGYQLQELNKNLEKLQQLTVTKIDENKFDNVKIDELIKCTSKTNNSEICTVILGAINPFNRRTIGIQEAINQGIINCDDQTYLCDVNYRETLSWHDAITKSFLISHEIKNEMLTPEFSKCVIQSQFEEFMDILDYEIVGVVNTNNGQILDSKIGKEAMIIDLKLCIFHDNKKDKWMPIKRAILQGLVLTRPKDKKCKVDRVFVEYVSVGEDQRHTSLEEAIRDNIVDILDNSYNISEEGVKMSLVEAVMCGIIKIIETPENDKLDNNRFLILHRSYDDPEIKDLFKLDANKPINVKILSKVQECDCWNEFVEINEKKESFAESIYNDHLEMDPLRCGEENKESVLIACVKGNVSLDKVVDLLGGMKELFVGEMIEDLDSICTSKDLLNRINSVSDINMKEVFVIDCDTMNIMSLDKIDAKMNEELLITRINVDEMENKLKQLHKLADNGVDINENVISKEGSNKEGIFDTSMMEAVMSDILSLDTLEVRDGGRDNELCGLEMSVDRLLIDEKTADDLLNFAEIMSFDKLIKDGIFNVESNTFGEEGSLLKAIEEEIIEPELVYLMVPETNEVMNLNKLIDTGVLDAQTNQVTMENAQKEVVTMKLSEAINIECGMLLSKVDALAIRRRLPKKFKKVSLENKLNYDKDIVLFLNTEVKEMNISEALESGLLFDDLRVKLDKGEDDDVKTIVFLDNIELVELIYEVNQLLDELSGIDAILGNEENVSIDSHGDTESDRVEKFELLLFDAMEKEKIVEDKIEIFTSAIKIHKAVVNPIQFSFLLAQMENVKNLSTKISKDIQGSQNALTKGDMLTCVSSVHDFINQLKLKFNTIDRNLVQLNKLKGSSLAKNILLQDLKDKCQKLKDYQQEITSLSPKFFDIKESLGELLNRSRACQDDNLARKLSETDKSFISLKRLRDSVCSNLDSLTPYFCNMIDNYNTVDQSLSNIEHMVYDCENQFKNETIHIPLNVQQLDNKFDIVCKFKRDVSAIQQVFDKLEKTLNNNFKTSKLYLSLENRFTGCADLLTNVRDSINFHQKELSQIKNRLNEIKDLSNLLAEKTMKIDRDLCEIKLKEKTEATFQNTIEIRKQFLETMNMFEQLQNSCDSYIGNSMYVTKDKLIGLRQNVTENQRELYGKINEELIFQVESLISLVLMELGKLQMFVLDLPKSWNTNSDDINSKIKEIKNYLDYLKDVERKLQNMDKILGEDLVDKLDINFDALENIILNIQYCEKERVTTHMDMEKILDIVCNSYLPTIMFYENNKQSADLSLTDIAKNISSVLREFISYTANGASKSEANFVDIIKEKKMDVEKLNEQLTGVEPVVSAVESYGVDIIEQLMNLTSDYGTGCNLLPDIKEEVQQITTRFNDIKNSISDLDKKMNDLITPTSKSLYMQVCDELESWRLINDVINRLDPVQSRPEKIKEQEQEIGVILDQIKEKEAQFHTFKQTVNEIITDTNAQQKVKDTNPDDAYNTVDGNQPADESQEITDALKDTETLVESMFFKVEHRNSVIKDIVSLSTDFWPEISSLNQTITNLQKASSITEVFPNNTETKTENLASQFSRESELCQDKSPCGSVDFEVEDELVDEEEKDITLAVTAILNNDINADIIKPSLVLQQDELLKKMDATVEECIVKLQSDLEPKAVQIIKAGGQSCAFEVNDYLETVWENVGLAQDNLGEKHIEIDKGLFLVNFLVDELKKMTEWFPMIENRLKSVTEVAADQKIIELNINQLKTIYSEVLSQFSKLEKLSSTMKELLNYPNVPNKSLIEDVKSQIDERYNDLITAIMDKHSELQDKFRAIGELDFVLDDNIGIMQELENQIKNFTRQTCKGDPQFTSSCLKNLKLLSRAFEKQELVINNLNDNIALYSEGQSDVGLTSRGALTIFGKLKEINDLTRSIKDLIPVKGKLLEEILKNEKLLSKDIHRFMDYLDTVKTFLKHSPKVGLTKDSVEQFSLNYMNCMKELNGKNDSIKSATEQANALISNCPYERCSSLATAVKTLSHKHRRCQELALKRKEKLDCYSQIIVGFDEDKMTLFQGVIELEKMSITKATPSKLTRTCAEQIKEIKNNIQKAERYIDVLERLTIRSFEIKCFGNVFDNSQLNLEFKECGLKVAKIQRCLRERLRIFKQAYKEDKLFSDSYDTLITWLDDSYILVDSFKLDPTKVQDHLDKLKRLCQQLSAQYANFHCTVRYGSYLKDRCLDIDPEKDILMDMLKTLKSKWCKIRNLIVAEKTNINRKMMETGNIFDAIKCISYWIHDLISKFDPKMKVNGDLDTVEVLMLDCQASCDEADIHSKDFSTLKERMLKEIKDYDESDIRKKMMEVDDQFMEYLSDLEKRKDALKDSLELAKDFNKKLDDIRVWANQAEKQLKLKSLPKFQNETELIELIGKHETFIKKLNDMKLVANDMNAIGKNILTNCHPSAKNYITRVMFVTGNKCNQIYQRGEARSKKLNEALGTLRGSTALIEELIQKVADYLNKIRIANNSKPPTDVQLASQLYTDHLVFHDDVIAMDLQIKGLIKEFKIRNPSCSNLQDKVLRYRDRAEFYQNTWRTSQSNINRITEDLTSNTRLNLLNNQFNVLWKLSVERKSSLHNKLIYINEQESLKKFDFNTWRGEFMTFIKNKGLRLTDLFRRQSIKKTGYLTEDEFVACFTKCGFSTNKAVLKEVFHIFNRSNDNMISYQEFIDATRSERRSIVDPKFKNANLDDKKVVMMIIHDTIEKAVAECTCRQRFFVKKEGENKYRFGNNSKQYMVRYLNSSVMVRIGGGWQNLTEFLRIHDPCRGEKVSIQMSGGDPQKFRKSKSSGQSEIKTGKLTLTKTTSLIDRPSITSSPKVGRSSVTAVPGDTHERPKKDQLLSTPSKAQTPKLSKLPKKK